MTHHGDALTVLRTMPAESVHCCVTSPPYYRLRDYGVAGQIGMEKTPAEYIARLVDVFGEVRRVLRPDGTLWVNIGDSYAATTKGSSGKGEKQVTNAGTLLVERKSSIPPGLKPKDLIGIPWMLAFALRDAGWWLRQDIIWSKPNPMPESVKDRCTKAHEYIFMLSKSARYFYDADAIKEDGVTAELFHGGYDKPGILKSTSSRNGRVDKQRGHSRKHDGFNSRWDAMSREEQCAVRRNKRSVWTFATMATPEAHFATFPITLPETCILAGCPEGGTVLDPFAGAGTTGLAAIKHGRQFIGIELNQEYISISHNRQMAKMPLFADTSTEEQS